MRKVISFERLNVNKKGDQKLVIGSGIKSEELKSTDAAQLMVVFQRISHVCWGGGRGAWG
jgi:hypothetical protein